MLSNKVAIVTGGSRGIGKAIALELAREGAIVVVNYNGSEEKAKAVLDEIQVLGGRGMIYQCNVSDFASCEKFFKEILEIYGKIDILVNNAGITRDGLIMRMSEEDYDMVMDTNLKGTFQCMRFVNRIMLKQKSGRIINISSVSGVLGNAGQANYAASKAGIIGLTKSVAREVASRGITVNAIAPGFIETEMTGVLHEKTKEMAVKQIPLGKFGRVEDIANMVVYLASDKSAYITGQVIHVDGGMAM
ncbi:MAG: 3-oxoacyl-[acyl-carrier-protein] reductase [Eubacteriales bacterium]